MKMDLNSGDWINQPSSHRITDNTIILETDPHTDFWQRTYYGFRNDNAPALLFESKDNFTLTARAKFDYKHRFDQCGLIIYRDSDNWFKASIEYENGDFARLGSVVTNLGYSDWATRDIEPRGEIWYRLNRRGPDFLIESSFDGIEFKQMRVFHLHSLGATSAEMGKANPPLPAENQVRFGIYACSPSDSSFKVEFSEIELEPCTWLAHGADQEASDI